LHLITKQNIYQRTTPDPLRTYQCHLYASMFKTIPAPTM